jgi:hypothetical protein
MRTSPEVKASLSDSTSLVRRVIRRPTGLPVEERRGEPLQVREHRLPQVEHHVLPGLLQDVELEEAEHELGDQRCQEQARRQQAAPPPCAARW